MVEAFEKAHGRAQNLGFLTPFPIWEGEDGSTA